MIDAHKMDRLMLDMLARSGWVELGYDTHSLSPFARKYCYYRVQAGLPLDMPVSKVGDWLEVDMHEEDMLEPVELSPEPEMTEAELEEHFRALRNLCTPETIIRSVIEDLRTMAWVTEDKDVVSTLVQAANSLTDVISVLKRGNDE